MRSLLAPSKASVMRFVSTATIFRSVLGLTVLGSILALAACSSDDDAPKNTPPLESEGGTLQPTNDAGSDADAATDANADADADVDAGPPRECSDDGLCHTQVPAGQTLRGVWADGAGIAWTVSEQGSILRWDGTTWSVHTTLKTGLTSIWGSGPNDIWVGSLGSLYHGVGSSSATLTFEEVVAPGEGPILAFWGTSANDVWAVGSDEGVYPRSSRILHYTSGIAGTGWKLDPISSANVNITQVWGTAESGVWIAGVRNHPTKGFMEVAAFRQPVGTNGFVAEPMPADPAAPTNDNTRMKRLHGASAATDGTIWIAGRAQQNTPINLRGTSADGGQTFTWEYWRDGKVQDPPMTALWANTANDAWLIGEYGRLRHWNGTAWNQAFVTVTNYPVTDALYGIWGHGQDDLWVVGQGTALHLDPSKKL